MSRRSLTRPKPALHRNALSERKTSSDVDADDPEPSVRTPAYSCTYNSREGNNFNIQSRDDGNLHSETLNIR